MLTQYLACRPPGPQSALQSVLEGSGPELGVVGPNPPQARPDRQPGEEVRVGQTGGAGAVHLHTARPGYRDLRQGEMIT